MPECELNWDGQALRVQLYAITSIMGARTGSVMDAERWRWISSLYHQALAQEQSMRAAFLAEACPDDAQLRREVEALLEIPSAEVLPLLDLMRADTHGALLQHQTEVPTGAAADETTQPREASNPRERPHRPEIEAREGIADSPTTIGTQPDATPPSFGLVREAAEFEGTARFVLQRRIGSGSFGVVYEARDLLNGTMVALKTLRHLDGQRLCSASRPSSERSPTSSHRNLVRLGELAWHDHGHWFFTMELVDGSHFTEHVCNRPIAPRTAMAASAPRSMAASLETLVPALRQLVDGLGALHRSGHIHRDVKPSNVLVTPVGRVVLLDFGLVLDAEREESFQSLMIAGTPLFMSPEQAAGLPLTPATDWYSVGVMLFQALTGGVPFAGTHLQVLTDKQRNAPPLPSSLVDGIPPHLEKLCLDLLHFA